MPLYNTATVATALGASPKWLDNLLSHNKIDGVSGGRQGVRRRLSVDAVRTVALVRELIEHAGLSTAGAVRLAATLVAGASAEAAPLHVPEGMRQRVRVSPALWVELDVAALDQEVSRGLAHAVEITPHPVRGRPRRRTRPD